MRSDHRSIPTFAYRVGIRFASPPARRMPDKASHRHLASAFRDLTARPRPSAGNPLQRARSPSQFSGPNRCMASSIWSAALESDCNTASQPDLTHTCGDPRAMVADCARRHNRERCAEWRGSVAAKWLRSGQGGYLGAEKGHSKLRVWRVGVSAIERSQRGATCADSARDAYCAVSEGAEIGSQRR